ncbi:acyltransferase family protein [Cupriavidus numazuensis]|uniref:O-acetyltransferase OatA n=1 Tax=Cupriavidus numazuensis TaxID=221992 RepID=A0ABM8TTS0_9BURK|nr:acyltransferase [Cupriavidus numazuensis]CAG2159880.1 O-acetyltransferase OatA [Cupriavidus numazuensis]
MTPSHQDKASPPGERLLQLDFLRGIAIIAVMGIHFFTVDTGSTLVWLVEYPLKHFGREGVTLFFTLSGFLVGGLLLREYAGTGTIDARRFIVRRMFKIWPAYYALILFHVVIGRHPRDTFLVQNTFHLQNYLGSSIAQTWSLAVEEHFYLLLPLALLGVARARPSPQTLLVLLAALCTLVLAGRLAAVAAGDLEGAYVYTHYRVDSLLYGVMLAVVYWLMPATYRALAARRTWLVAGVALLLAWLLCLQRTVALQEGIGFTVQSIGFCALIVLVLEHSGRLRETLAYRSVAWIGVYSYGIYLWHTVAREPGRIVIRTALEWGWPPLLIWALATVLQFAIAIVAGYVTTRLVEFPFLRLRETVMPARRSALPAEGMATDRNDPRRIGPSPRQQGVVD